MLLCLSRLSFTAACGWKRELCSIYLSYILHLPLNVKVSVKQRLVIFIREVQTCTNIRFNKQFDIL